MDKAVFFNYLFKPFSFIFFIFDIEKKDDQLKASDYDNEKLNKHNLNGKIL